MVFYRHFLLILAISAFFVAGGQAETLVMGVYTSDKPTVMFKKFNPILGHLQDSAAGQGLPLDFKLRIFPSYRLAVQALARGAVDFARFGPASYIHAKEKNPNIRLLVMEHKKGSKRFKGIFIAPSDSPIRSIHDLKGKTFAFGNPFSTIGRYLSQAEFVRAKIYAKDLKKYSYLGRHDKVILAVANGLYDAGVVKENTFRKYADSRGLKKIGEFPNVTKPWVVRQDFEEKWFRMIQAALLNLKDRILLQALGQDGFLLAEDADYDFVRRKMNLSQAFSQE